MVDHHVDRPGVEAQQCVKLTGTNSSIGLIVLIASAHPESRMACLSSRMSAACVAILRTGRRTNQAKATQLLETCASSTWWSWRGGCTRSHSELGRETPQRQWYFVSRRGRVGRRQVYETHDKSSHHKSRRKHSAQTISVIRVEQHPPDRRSRKASRTGKPEKSGLPPGRQKPIKLTRGGAAR